ncbi:MAG TPA: GNAT family N-acetyltransferase [Candidatus Limnocylindrales bacterium]|jgi:predicted acetyltransferase|nr:GNAT family N-acetyltransferase [Candidatus Limnocylindrales bacterium]
MPPTIRPVRDDELASWFAAFGTAFYIWASDPEASAAARRPSMDLERTIGAFDDDAIVGTFRTFPTKLTLPGCARVDVSAVSAVSVRPTHRRRGILTQLIADDVRRSVDRGDVASILIAAEWPIYGRFGYGPATWQAEWSFRTRQADVIAEPVGSVEIIDRRRAREILPDLYDRCAAKQPGEIGRTLARWDNELGIVEIPGRPAWRGAVVLHRNAAGEPDGFARFHGEEHWVDMSPDHVMLVDDLHGETPEAELDLWRHLAQMDLTATIRTEHPRRPMEPLKWILSNPRAAQVSGHADFLWVRIFDVPGFLGARTYAGDGAIVIEVKDDLGGKDGPAAGRYRLEVQDGVATCERTRSAPDLSVDVRSLSAASLGGTRLVDATRAQPFEEHRSGALADADALFLTPDPPWCSTWF